MLVCGIVIFPGSWLGAQEAAASKKLVKILEPIREKAKLPAMGAAVVENGELKALGAVGFRKYGGRAEVTDGDKWHIGSCTKSMTATLAATFVEEGKLKWETTIGEILCKKMRRMREEYKGVTLLQLLTNRSGIPGKVPAEIWEDAWAGRGGIRRQRTDFVEAMLKTPPSFPPGTQYEYSNSGFVTAGAMLEILSGKSWESLMKERIFKPLKMTSAGFGNAASGSGRADQPWPHDSPTKPHPPGKGDDNPVVLGPAGTVHASLTDLARYVNMHLQKTTGPVLKEEKTFDGLHTIGEGNDDYACGWIVTERGWAKGTALTHSGSNKMNYCVFWLAPERKFAVIIVTNVGDAVAPCDEVAASVIKEFLR